MPARPPEPPDFAASQLFLRRLAYSLVRDEARAEDLVQETWATWVERRPSGLAEPRAWLARVLRNRAFNLKRADERRARHEDLAGRPDPSGPETDGTLEAQAQLLEALRKLEEPYRSTLVQRYYHDLPPSAIAERAGAPLNTVKARLARGLEKLRAEMDRRYHGDRRAWSHWLTVLGAPPVPVAVPSGTSAAAPLAGSGASGSILAWCGLAAALVAVGVWRSTSKPATRESAPPVAPSEPPARELSARRENAASATSGDERPHARESLPPPRPRVPQALVEPPQPAPEPSLAAPNLPRDSFDWPQFGGGPTHNNFRAREDEIHAPRVLWFVPGCAGQPTIDGDDLYTGGFTVARLDTSTGAVEALGWGLLPDALGFEDEEGRAGMKVLLELMGGARDPERKLEGLDPEAMNALIEILGGEGGLEQRLEALDTNDPAVHTAVGSPALTAKHVLVRSARDGSVIAYDRDLNEEAWRWDSGWDPGTTGSPSTRIPLCVTEEETILVPLHDSLVALRAADGRERWRYSVNGVIEMVPAAHEGRVFFGTDRGLLVALSASTGNVLWRTGTEGFLSAAPVVTERRLLAVTRRWADRFSDTFLRAWDTRKGDSLWKHQAFLEPEGFGLGEKARDVVLLQFSGAERVDLENGQADFSRRIELSEFKPLGTPLVVGSHLVFASDGGRLNVYDTEGKGLCWAFQLPKGAQVQDFVHTGRRLYVATTIGLVCLADDPARVALGPGFVLDWEGDPRLPSYLVDDK